MTTPLGVSCPMSCLVIGDRGWVQTPLVLRYSQANPFEVQAAFGGAVTWYLSRDVIREGLVGPAGGGDARLWPAKPPSDALFLHLRSVSGEALMELSKNVVGLFLAQTDRLVPPGTEQMVGLDAWLDTLTEGSTE